MSVHKGQCMCGSVRFTARDVPVTCGACHCEMCRRWTGSALIGVTVKTENVSFNGPTLRTIQSSDWAERGFCARCGTGMYFKVTAEGPWHGNTEIPLGVFDDPDGFTMTNEIYFDHKPDSFAYEGSEARTLLTRADCVEKFGALDD